MDPFETMRAMGELWGRGVRSFMDAQYNVMGAMNTAVPGGFAIPSDLASMQKAQAAFGQAWTTAQEIAGNVTDGIKALEETARERGDPIAADVLAKVLDPRGWLSASNEIDEAVNRMAQGPQLADLWTYERKYAALFSAWTALRRCNLEHNTLMLETWTKATGVFAKAVDARAEDGQPVESARALMSLWIETANDVLLETQRSEDFLKSQRETLKAATDLRLAQQAIAEVFAEIYGAPSRSEIDDVHRSLTDLRRELRALKRTERARATVERKMVASETASAPSDPPVVRARKPARRAGVKSAMEGTAP